ncbi:hypothetical protein [Actinotalea sp.]|uniref:hypothetical protein n=1 Tax=Actinotalea sp. TaxID=1872145 RepID=UPI002C3A3078|nr:hypothetical protein [Actinotalea sp.]HQY34124.1 hypothetical protein [Actinotalea sp.]HRA49491.1 hypothetical protein [Actinotalea sp.]
MSTPGTPDGAAPDGGAGVAGDGPPRPARAGARERKAMLLRLDPAVHDALARWAAEDLRSTNAHVEWLLRRAVEQAGRLPREQA